MCDIEQGRCKPSLQVALQIAKALGVKDIKFFDEQGKMYIKVKEKDEEK